VKRLLVIGALAALAAGCGGGDGPSSSIASGGSTCPKAWLAGWQKLADDVGEPVYCPGWMPYPLDGKIDGNYKNGRWVDEKDKSYLVSFLWVDSDGGVSREVHVNLRGYPGRTDVPVCETQSTAGGKTVRKPTPCFADEREQRTIGDIEATVYTVNQGIDAWHVLYAWPKDGTLYTISEHVVAPYTYKDVVRNLDRMARRLAVVEPAA
jgi:hypothetical protein